MKNIYENKKIWKFYFILVIFLIPLVTATVRTVNFDTTDAVVFILFHVISPYIMITLLIREVVLQEVDKNDTINLKEIKIKRVASYTGIIFFVFSYIMDSIFILNPGKETFSLVMLLVTWILLLDSGVIITKNKIYYRNRIIEQKEIARIEEKNANNIRIYLKNGKDLRIRYRKITSYIVDFKSKVK